MDLFGKCSEFNKMVEYIKSQNQFFYLREIDPAATPRVTMNGKEIIMLGSNNYLGLTSHPKVIESTINAIKEYGTGACSSRVLTGTTSLHTRLEKKLAEFKGTEDAVIFSTGYMTMMGTISAVTTAGDIILSDELNHASIVEGCRLSKAKKMIYKHNDMENLDEKLSQCDPSANKIIITDGVFSMKGTVANLPEIKKLANKYNAMIMVDDAHGTGVLGARGRGTLEHFDMEGEIDLVCGTFSKSLGTIGGFTGSKKEIITFLKLNSRPFIFTASPPPSVAATVLACLEVIDEEPGLYSKLRENTVFMKNGLKDMGFVLEETITPIIPILVGDNEKTFKMTGMLEDEGVFVNPVVPPAVPKESSLIRVSIMASLAIKDLEFSLDKFKLAGKKLGII
ncbi:MAG: pyridoxal phosphate-dependent aminotransferase family protein [candidate division WOR-3 bacterium]|nr:MAG: pyridoxal phosphate-dependent aminotransferase family protein [candidate division WOR-3 bacterium]